MSRKQTPEIINLSESELEAIKSRVALSSALEDDKKIILSILSTHQWLYRQLRSTKLTINRLKNLFGFTTEKRPKITKDDLNALLAAGDSQNGLMENAKTSGIEVPPVKKFDSPNGILKPIMGE
jgi:hypothetical protein